MVKYKCHHDFRGKKEKKDFEGGKEYDFTVERAEEINEGLEKNYDLKNTLTRVNPPKSKRKPKTEESK